MTSAQLIDAFMSYMIHNRGRSRRLGEVYGLALGRLVTFLTPLGKGLLDATHEDLIAFSGPHLFSLGLKDPMSRRTHISGVRGFYKWAKSQGHSADDTAAAVPQPKHGFKLPRVISLADIEKLMWAPDFSKAKGVRDAAMIACLAGCGLRISGLLGLNESNVIHDKVDGVPRLFFKVMEKGNRERKIPIPEQAALLLQLYMDHPDLAAVDRALPNGDKVLFVAFQRGPRIQVHEFRGERRRLSSDAVFASLHRYAKLVGVDATFAHAHALRHAYGTELAEDDVPTATAQRLLGHADAKHTALYQQLALRKLTRTVDKSNPLAKIKTPVSELISNIKKR